MGVLKDRNLLDLVVKRNNTKKDVLLEFGLQPNGRNYKTLDYYISLFNINNSHFLTRKEIYKKTGLSFSRVIPFDDIFCNPTKSTLNNQYKKKKLIDANMKEDKCELCNQNNIWNGKLINLQLDHIDGNNKNDSISNLRILCPNCHSQTKTYAGRNIKNLSKNKKLKEKQLKKELKLENIKQQLIESKIDFSKKTWGVEVSKLLSKSPQYCLKFVKENFKELLY